MSGCTFQCLQGPSVYRPVEERNYHNNNFCFPATFVSFILLMGCDMIEYYIYGTFRICIKSLITLYVQIDSSFWFDTINLGWSNMNISRGHKF